MRQYRVSNQANTDLTDIWLDAAQDTQAAADRLLDRIYQAFQKISDMPGIGHRRDDLTGQRLRFWSVGQYMIIYSLETDPLETRASSAATATSPLCCWNNVL